MATRHSTGAARAKRTRNRFTAADANLFFNRLKRSRPICTEGDVARVDHELMRGGMALNRRVAMMILTRPGKFVIDWARGDRKTAVAMADGVLGIRDTVKRMRELADLLEAAEWRLAIALCEREDMTSVYAEAKQPEEEASHD
jgi:hypothetical protein